MDTKLKKSKFNPIIKFIVLIFTLVFAFLSATSILDLARKTIYFNYETEDLRNTNAFSNNIVHNLYEMTWQAYLLQDFSQGMTFEEYCEKSETAKALKTEYSEKTNKALDIFGRITEIKKLEPPQDATSYEHESGYFYDKNGNVYYGISEFQDYLNNLDPRGDYYNNEVTVPSRVNTVPSTTNNLETTAVQYNYIEGGEISIPGGFICHAEWEYYYQLLRDEIFSLVNDARSRDTIIDEINLELQETLRTHFQNDKEHYSSQKRFLSDSLKYYIVNNKNGNYFSTFETNEEIENFKRTFKNDYYYFYCSGDKYKATPISLNYPDTLFFNLLSKIREFEPDINLKYQDVLYYTEDCTLYFSIEKPTTEDDAFYSLLNTFNETKDLKFSTLELQSIIFSCLTLLGIVILSILSGRAKNDSIKLNLSDKTFFIIHLAFFLGIATLGVAGIVGFILCDFGPEMTYTEPIIEFIVNNNLSKNIIALFFAITILVTINFITYISKNIKAKTFKERFICYKIAKTLKIIIAKNKELRKSVKQIEKNVLIIFSIWSAIQLILAITSIVCAFCDAEGGVLLCMILFLALLILGFVVALKLLTQIKTLALAVEEMKNGNLNISLTPEKYIFFLRDFARNLNECRDSIDNAVKEALKGERLKTELITNVSHDLKTPLTSIINYVSLLKLCEIEGEDEKKYLDILDEKSKKLQRLIEDLTEASKATTGNIKMNIDTVNLTELALQAVGENNDVLESVGLDIVFSPKDDDLFVKADSKRTFRVFDNLFSNAKKYALTGTRVYVDVYKENEFAIFSIKNVSKEKLNINPQELTERFVRGDNSRTSEGSGLGLSIARSFTELQNGTFSIDIDGDLFKVTIKLPITSKPQIKPETLVHTENEFGVTREKTVK